MKKYNIQDMIKGWFVGGFEPTVFKTTNCEVGYKEYNSGDNEPKHYHKIATEITVIIEGSVKMNNVIYKKGDIIVIEPNESTDFISLENSKTIVVKIPGALNDKYIS
jgi:quercetin dioxygenase-like cupin family protein